MTDLLNLAWKDLLTFLFVFVRIGVVFATVPFFSADNVPRRITAIIAFFLGLILLPVIPRLVVDIQTVNVLYLLMVLLHEVFLGIGLGLAITVIFAGVQIAGELMGYSMGFAIVNALDPVTGTEAPITANFFYIVAFLLFLTFDGHHLFIKAIQQSFTMAPIGAGLPRPQFLSATITYAAEMFTIALKLAAPIIGILLIINIAIALISRAIPQMNVFIVSFPILIVVGMLFMILTIKMMPFFLQGPIQAAWAYMQAAMKLF